MIVQLGNRVYHNTFGFGYVCDVANDFRITIRFDKADYRLGSWGDILEPRVWHYDYDKLNGSMMSTDGIEPPQIIEDCEESFYRDLLNE